jgi:hypothetical protein
VKIACKVAGNEATVVGYCPGKKGKIYAIVISNGKLMSVALKNVELPELPSLRPSEVLKMRGAK